MVLNDVQLMLVSFFLLYFQSFYNADLNVLFYHEKQNLR